MPASECTARDSVITHGPSGGTLSYGAVATKAAAMPAPDAVTLKDPADWRVIGTPRARLDTREKVDGSLKYAADLSFPGMLHAAIHACPVHGGVRVAVKADKARGMPGVRAVLDVGEDAVAVVADSWWQAKKALDTVEVEWDTGAAGKVSSATIQAMLEEGLEADDVFLGNEKGDAKAALAAAADTLSADYSYPFQNHAPMEPMNTTAIWTK